MLVQFWVGWCPHRSNPPALRLAWQATRAQPVTRECFDSLYAGSVQAAGTTVAYFQNDCFVDFRIAEPASFPVFALKWIKVYKGKIFTILEVG